MKFSYGIQKICLCPLAGAKVDLTRGACRVRWGILSVGSKSWVAERKRKWARRRARESERCVLTGIHSSKSKPVMTKCEKLIDACNAMHPVTTSEMRTRGVSLFGFPPFILFHWATWKWRHGCSLVLSLLSSFALVVFDAPYVNLKKTKISRWATKSK